MAKKAKAKKPAEKKTKKTKDESAEEHQKKHGPDVKRLLEEYEEKEGDLIDEEEFISQHIDTEPKESEEF